MKARLTLAFALLLSACSSPAPEAPATTTLPEAAATTSTEGATATTLSPTATAPTATAPTGAAPAALNPGGAPPWAGEPIASGAARDVGIREWRASQPEAGDKLILPADPGLSDRSKPRRAEFGGSQWAVVWDDPGKPGVFATGGYCDTCGRGTAGIASQISGVDPDRETAVRLSWNDGTKVGYGPVAAVRDGGAEVPEGQWRAAIVVPGHSAGYYLWSYQGREHLERLLGQLRFVAGAP